MTLHEPPPKTFQMRSGLFHGQSGESLWLWTHGLLSLVGSVGAVGLRTGCVRARVADALSSSLIRLKFFGGGHEAAILGGKPGQ